MWDVMSRARLRVISVEVPVLRGRWQIGNVIFHLGSIYVYNSEGRRIVDSGVVMRVEHGHHVGMIHHYHDEQSSATKQQEQAQRMHKQLILMHDAGPFHAH